jgi:hypothetical protein
MPLMEDFGGIMIQRKRERTFSTAFKLLFHAV